MTRLPAVGTTLAKAGGQRAPAAIVLGAACVAVVWIAAELLRRDGGLGTPAYDQAYFQQVVWNLDHGHGFTSSFTAGSFLGQHFSPLLLVPSGFELLWTDPRMLSLIDAAAIALSAPATFLFLRAAWAPSRRGAYLAAGVAAVLPFTPIMQEAARAGFHTEVLALPAALVAGWAGFSRRPAVAWAAAAVTLMAKEDQVYTVAVIGLLIALRGRARMRRQGWWMVGVAAVWGLAAFFVIMPALRNGAALDTSNYYGWLGSGPAQLLAPIREPGTVLIQLWSHPAGWGAAAVLVACCCGLPLLRPGWMLLILPPLAVNLLSRHEPQPELQLQYGLLLILPAIVATAMGGRTALAWIERRRRRRVRTGKPVVRAATAAFALSVFPGLLLGALLGTVPPAANRLAVFMQEPALATLAAITAVIPAGAPVAADNDVAAPLASRSKLLLLPAMCPDCYLVVDRVPSPQSFLSPAQRQALFAQLAGHRRLLADDGRFQVWSPVDA